MKTLAERLAWARNEKGLSQQQLADRTGVAQSTIGSLEAGTRKTARKITALASALEVSSDWLADGVGMAKQSPKLVHASSPAVKRTLLQRVDDEEAEMLSEFRALGRAERETALVVLRSLPKAAADDRSDQG